MTERFLIMPAADLAVYDRIKFAIAGATSRGPNSVRWEIQPVPLKARTEYAIPEDVLAHKAFLPLRGRLRGYAVELLNYPDDFDVPDDVNE